LSTMYAQRLFGGMHTKEGSRPRSFSVVLWSMWKAWPPCWDIYGSQGDAAMLQTKIIHKVTIMVDWFRCF
jgi:hypothetical protein